MTDVSHAPASGLRAPQHGIYNLEESNKAHANNAKHAITRGKGWFCECRRLSPKN